MTKTIGYSYQSLNLAKIMASKLITIRYFYCSAYFVVIVETKLVLHNNEKHGFEKLRNLNISFRFFHSLFLVKMVILIEKRLFMILMSLSFTDNAIQKFFSYFK